MRYLYFFIFLLFLFPTAAARANDGLDRGEYILFVGAGCPHCAEVERYLDEQILPDGVTITRQDIYTDHENAVLFNAMTDKLGIPIRQRAIPLLIAPGDRVLIGDIPIIRYFGEMLDDDSQAHSGEETTSEETTCDLTLPECSEKAASINAWLLVSAALADSINPCAFAVLILLMTSMLAAGDRRRALMTGLAFVGTVFVSYFAMGFGLYHALATVSSTFWVYLLVGILAVLVGLFNLKDAIWYGKGFLMEVPLSWRPRMKALVRSIANPRGAIVIALVISLFLLPCTSGPYIVILGMLSQSAFDAKALLMLALYNVIFVLPMLALAIAAYAGVSVKRAESLRQNHVRTLHAVAGVLMLCIGLWVLMGLR